MLLSFLPVVWHSCGIPLPTQSLRTSSCYLSKCFFEVIFVFNSSLHISLPSFGLCFTGTFKKNLPQVILVLSQIRPWWIMKQVLQDRCLAFSALMLLVGCQEVVVLRDRCHCSCQTSSAKLLKENGGCIEDDSNWLMMLFVIQALVTWMRYLSYVEKMLMQLILVTEPLYIRVSVADLLWGQRIALWEKMRQHFPGLIPNDTWFGLMYRVNFIHWW